MRSKHHMPLSNTLVLLFSMFVSLLGLAQERFTLSGTISEASSNETLIGVTVAFPEMETGTITNEYGFYSISLPKGEYNLVISYLGFKEISQRLLLDKDQTMNFSLAEEAEQLNEVVVSENVERLDIRKPQMSVNGHCRCLRGRSEHRGSR